MGIFELFGKKSVSNSTPYLIEYHIHPIRLLARKPDYSELNIYLRNTFDKELLTSLVVVIPRELGFEQMGLSQEKEVRLGHMQPGEKKEIKLQIWSTQRTEKGEYPIKIYAISHYQDYAHVLNEVKLEFSIRAV